VLDILCYQTPSLHTDAAVRFLLHVIARRLVHSKTYIYVLGDWLEGYGMNGMFMSRLVNVSDISTSLVHMRPVVKTMSTDGIDDPHLMYHPLSLYSSTSYSHHSRLLFQL